MFGDIYQNRKVFVTGHTGFKGSWLHLWLGRLGASVTGYSLGPPSEPSHHVVLGLSPDHSPADVRDFPQLAGVLSAAGPEIVFHLAAQPIVRRSYADPLETFSTNVLGTANVLEACRRAPSVRACVVVTSDKCYENKDWVWGYRETDPVGGHDPYSASKGCAELVTASFRRSFFEAPDGESGAQVLVASARAGNVIGGGDWGEDRLTPDVMRAAAAGRPVGLRHPESVRPWQHVLDVLAGYLLLGQRLLEGRREFGDPWNFSPGAEACRNVRSVVETYKRYWDKIEYRTVTEDNPPRESAWLLLDSSKARHRLGWAPLWEGETGFARTVEWYRRFCEENRPVSRDQLEEYFGDAVKKGAAW
ncbi:MAG: CDP-glucose 4,6-dehydratase, partial [Thermodesulfobacteriota bacterium]